MPRWMDYTWSAVWPHSEAVRSVLTRAQAAESGTSQRNHAQAEQNGSMEANVNNEQLVKDWHNPRKTNKETVAPAECYKDALPKIGSKTIWLGQTNAIFCSTRSNTRIRHLFAMSPCIVKENDDNTVWFVSAHNVCGYICSCSLCQQMWVDHTKLELDSLDLQRASREDDVIQNNMISYKPVYVGHLGVMAPARELSPASFAKYITHRDVDKIETIDMSEYVVERVKETVRIRTARRTVRLEAAESWAVAGTMPDTDIVF